FVCFVGDRLVRDILKVNVVKIDILDRELAPVTKYTPLDASSFENTFPDWDTVLGAGAPPSSANGQILSSLEFVKDDNGHSVTTSFTAVITNVASGEQTTQTFAQCGAGTPDWWNSAWTQRQKIEFDNSARNTDLIAFPVKVVLDKFRINYGKTQVAGQDLRFVTSDGTTILSHLIEQWDPADTSIIWVKVPLIHANSNADFIWMYYDNSTATDGQNLTEWQFDYTAIWQATIGAKEKFVLFSSPDHFAPTYRTVDAKYEVTLGLTPEFIKDDETFGCTFTVIDANQRRVSCVIPFQASGTAGAFGAALDLYSGVQNALGGSRYDACIGVGVSGTHAIWASVKGLDPNLLTDAKIVFSTRATPDGPDIATLERKLYKDVNVENLSALAMLTTGDSSFENGLKMPAIARYLRTELVLTNGQKIPNIHDLETKGDGDLPELPKDKVGYKGGEFTDPITGEKMIVIRLPGGELKKVKDISKVDKDTGLYIVDGDTPGDQANLITLTASQEAYVKRMLDPVPPIIRAVVEKAGLNKPENYLFVLLTYKAFGGDVEAIDEARKAFENGATFEEVAIKQAGVGAVQGAIIAGTAGLGKVGIKILKAASKSKAWMRLMWLCGKSHEELVFHLHGLKKNTKHFPTKVKYTTGGYIIPDSVDGSVLHEIKGSLTPDTEIPMTNQFKGYFDVLGFEYDTALKKWKKDSASAVTQYKTLILHTPPGKPLSNSLKDAIQQVNSEREVIHIIEDIFYHD
ncbi:MAG: DUF2341 domain-containing protein, partial [Planctomycetota bacterium]